MYNFTNARIWRKNSTAIESNIESQKFVHSHLIQHKGFIDASFFSARSAQTRPRLKQLMYEFHVQMTCKQKFQRFGLIGII